MRRVFICFALLIIVSPVAHAGRAAPKSPWQVFAVCGNDRIVDNLPIGKGEFLIPDTGTRWKCRVSALDPATDGRSASRDLVCSPGTGLTVTDGVDTLRGAKHDAHLHVQDSARGCWVSLIFGG